MSIYWKQTLWIGGIYWVISLMFGWSDILALNLLDVCLSVFLLFFMIPMNWLQPVKKIDEAMRKSPVMSTFLVAVGWVPYFVGAIFVVSVFAAVILAGSEPYSDEKLFYVFNAVLWMSMIRQFLMAVAVLAAAVSVLAFKKSVMGCLDKHFMLSGDGACDIRTTSEPAKASAKVMYTCKTESKAKKLAAKKTAKPEVAKKAVVKKTAVKKAAVKKPAVASKAPKKASAKKA